MPNVRVSGVPADVPPKVIADLRAAIQNAVMSIKELEIGALDWTAVYFVAPHPGDRPTSGRSTNPVRILIEVAGLFRGQDWPQRSPEVRQRLVFAIASVMERAVRIRRTVGCGLDKVAMIEVLEWPFDTTLADPLESADVPANRQGYSCVTIDNDKS